MTIIEFKKTIPWHIRASWGISDIKEEKRERDTFSFTVSGRNYTGPVSITQKHAAGPIMILTESGKTFCTKKSLQKELDTIIES